MPRWVPNAITLLRLVLLGVFVGLMGGYEVTRGGLPGGMRGVSAILALLALGGSDLLDGYLARKHGLTSKLGVILDAAADKAAQLGIVAYFVFLDPRMPYWFLGLLILRDIAIGLGIWVIIRFRPGVRIEHDAHGKASSTLMFLLFVWATFGLAPGPMTGLLWVVSTLVVWSTAVYVRDGVRTLRSTQASA